MSQAAVAKRKADEDYNRLRKRFGLSTTDHAVPITSLQFANTEGSTMYCRIEHILRTESAEEEDSSTEKYLLNYKLTID